MPAPRFSPGAPCWAGLRSADLPASTAFYAGLFGWKASAAGNGYLVYSLGGRAVAGCGPRLSESQQLGWCTYLGVYDADRAVAEASRSGATVQAEPFDVPDTGRVGILTDPFGAEVWVWQPAGFSGADVNGEPGAVCGYELDVDDLDAARAFYGRVFGAEAAALCRRPPADQSQLAAEWRVSFAVADAAAAAARACALGGSIVASTSRSATIADPQGCRFSAIEPGAT